MARRPNGVPAPCHPDRPLYAKGLCLSCYNQVSHQRRMMQSGFPERLRKRAAQWRLDNPDHARAVDYAKHLRRKFGLTPQQYTALLETQQGVCAICAGPSRTGKRFHIDHCHRTGKVRAILCHHCNAGFGQFHDSAELLRAAANYLEAHG